MEEVQKIIKHPIGDRTSGNPPLSHTLTHSHTYTLTYTCGSQKPKPTS
jgi:hypothetical protein